jgi:tetrahydromethanopterin S-methyltransferase subunit G
MGWYKSYPTSAPVGKGIGAVVGFLGGAVVGVLLPSHEMIYSVNSQ